MKQEPLPKIYMAGPWITEKEVELVVDAMRNGWYDKAYYYVETLEREFAAYHGRKYALMTPNCTSAIHLLLAALGIGDGDEVLVPECTWIASAAPISQLRAKQVFCDIDPQSWCIDPAAIEANITPRTKAIIAVDLFGNMANWAALDALSTKYGIPVIEDAAEALGSTWRGKRAGAFGVGSVFSFHRTKTMTTGEGGMLLLDDDHLFERCRILRDHGRRPDGPMYVNFEVAFKYMPFNLQAALGYGQFLRLEELVQRKRWIFESYRARLADIPDLQWNDEPAQVFNSVWTTALVFGHSHGLSKADAMARLAALNVPSRPFFYPLSALPAFGSQEAEFSQRNPNAYDVSSRGINLSSAMNLTEGQIDFICHGLRRILGY